MNEPVPPALLEHVINYTYGESQKRTRTRQDQDDYTKTLRFLGMPASLATHSGHTLAWQLVLVSVAAAAITVAYGQFAGRFRFPEVLRRAYAALLAAAVLFGFGAVVIHYGGQAPAISHLRR
jgi:hypothetical protein